MGQHRNESAPADPRLALRRFHWTSGGATDFLRFR